MKNYPVRVRGLKLHVQEEGEGAPVLFLHGWGATWKFWRGAIAALSPRLRCVAFDWPGFGVSDKPDAPYTVEWFADILKGAMEALRIDEARIVAHSMAGAVASTFALEYPGRVRKLVLVNALVHGRSAFSLPKRLAALPGVRRLAWWLAHIRWIRRAVAGPFSHAARMDEDMVDDVLCSTHSSIFRTFDSLRRVDLVSRLSALRPPTYVINTDRDRILRPTQLELQREIFPETRMKVIPDTGHCPMLERPDEFNRSLEEFLEGPP